MFKFNNNIKQITISSMRIIKRLSLHASLYHRLVAAKPTDPYLERLLDKKDYQQPKMTIEQQLSKYGYRNVVEHTPLKIMCAIVLIVFSGVVYVYIQQLYVNQKEVRHKYRIYEQENSSILLILRSYLVTFGQFINDNLFINSLIASKPNKIDRLSEASLRTQQYRYYMKNRDDKFDFLDLGIMDKFPYPDREVTK